MKARGSGGTHCDGQNGREKRKGLGSSHTRLMFEPIFNFQLSSLDLPEFLSVLFKLFPKFFSWGKVLQVEFSFWHILLFPKCRSFFSAGSIRRHFRSYSSFLCQKSWENDVGTKGEGVDKSPISSYHLFPRRRLT